MRRILFALLPFAIGWFRRRQQRKRGASGTGATGTRAARGR